MDKQRIRGSYRYSLIVYTLGVTTNCSCFPDFHIYYYVLCDCKEVYGIQYRVVIDYNKLKIQPILYRVNSDVYLFKRFTVAHIDKAQQYTCK